MTKSGPMTPEEAHALHWEAREADILTIWTVTTGTADFGSRFVARPAFVGDVREAVVGASAETVAGVFASARYLIADTLEDLRRQIPAGLFRMDRQESESRVVVESWF